MKIVKGLDPNKYYISGTFMTAECPDRNGCRIAREDIDAAMKKYKTEHIDTKTSGGHADHQEIIIDGKGNEFTSSSSYGSVRDVVLRVVDLHWESDEDPNLYGTAEMLDDGGLGTQLIGKMESGIRFYISVDADCNMCSDGYARNLSIKSFDLVNRGANPGSVVFLHKGDGRLLNHELREKYNFMDKVNFRQEMLKQASHNRKYIVKTNNKLNDREFRNLTDALEFARTDGDVIGMTAEVWDVDGLGDYNFDGYEDVSHLLAENGIELKQSVSTLGTPNEPFIRPKDIKCDLKEYNAIEQKIERALDFWAGIENPTHSDVAMLKNMVNKNLAEKIMNLNKKQIRQSEINDLVDGDLTLKDWANGFRDQLPGVGIISAIKKELEDMEIKPEDLISVGRLTFGEIKNKYPDLTIWDEEIKDLKY